MAAAFSSPSSEKLSLVTRKDDDSSSMQEGPDSLIQQDKKTIHDLPYDDLLNVLSFLPPKDVDKVRCVSRPLKGIVDVKRRFLPRHRAGIFVLDAPGGGIAVELRFPPSAQKIRLPCTQVSELVHALTGKPSSLFPALLFPLLRPSLDLRAVFLGSPDDGAPLEASSVPDFDADVAALNKVLPPSTRIFFHAKIDSLSYDTLKAVAVKREIILAMCGMPRWEEKSDPRPVTSNLISFHAEDVGEDNRNFVRAVLALSTCIEMSYFPTTLDGLDENRHLMKSVAGTADNLILHAGPWNESTVLDLAAIPHFECNECGLSDVIGTTTIRKLVDVYLKKEREASATLHVHSGDPNLTAFFPLRHGFIGNTLATEDQQRDRKDTCLDGDSFLFTSRRFSVKIKCSVSTVRRFQRSVLSFHVIASTWSRPRSQE